MRGVITMQQPHKLTPDTAAMQSALAEVCRSGVVTELPGTTSPERLATYRSLIHGNFEDTLSRAFPIAKKALRRKRWERVVDDFVSGHPSASPQLWRMPEEFCRFILAGDYGRRFRLPYLNDLIRFEWAEIEVFMMEDINPAPGTLAPFNEAGSLVVNREYRTLALEYPVFEPIAAGFSKRKGSFDLITFRNPSTLYVEYMLVTPLVLGVLSVLAEAPQPLVRALAVCCKTLGIPCTDELNGASLEMIRNLHARGMILGTRK